jgi:transcriptional regulator with XRE-family HTH domain
MDGSSFAPIRLPEGEWRTAAVLRALRSRDLPAIFHLARRYHISSDRIAANTGIDQDRVSEIMRGKRQPISTEMIARIANGFDMPDHACVALGLALRPAKQLPKQSVDQSQDTSPGTKQTVIVSECSASTKKDKFDPHRVLIGNRLKAERRQRVGSTNAMARALRDNAPESERKTLPTMESIVRMIRSWESGQHSLSERYQFLYCRALGADRQELFEIPGERGAVLRDVSSSQDIQSFVDWIGETNTSDDAIEQITRATLYLAEVHSQIPAKKVLSEVLSLHGRAQMLLRSGKQRFHQTRELLRIESNLLAHACA